MAIKGRPTKYTEQLADEICERLAGGEALIRICRPDDMPHESTVRQWDRVSFETRNDASPKYPGFYTKYAHARDLGIDHLAEETIEIADDGRNDTYIDDEGNEQVDHDHIRRSQLRVAARQWYISKVAPKKYGDKQEIKHSGSMGVAVQAPPADVESAMRKMLGRDKPND